MPADSTNASSADLQIAVNDVLLQTEDVDLMYTLERYHADVFSRIGCRRVEAGRLVRCGVLKGSPVALLFTRGASTPQEENVPYAYVRHGFFQGSGPSAGPPEVLSYFSSGARFYAPDSASYVKMRPISLSKDDLKAPKSLDDGYFAIDTELLDSMYVSSVFQEHYFNIATIVKVLASSRRTSCGSCIVCHGSSAIKIKWDARPKVLGFPEDVRPHTTPETFMDFPYSEREPSIQKFLWDEICARHRMVVNSSETLAEYMKKYHSKVTHLFNYSGVGKTRGAMQLGTIVDLVVLMMNFSRHSNGTSRSEVSLAIADQLAKYAHPSNMDPHTIFTLEQLYSCIHIVLVRLLYLCYKHRDNHEGCYEVDKVVGQECKGRSKECTLQIYVEEVLFCGMKPWEHNIKVADSGSYDEPGQSEWPADTFGQVARWLNPSQTTDDTRPRFIVVFDEFHNLLEGGADGKGTISVMHEGVHRSLDMMRGIRAAFRNYEFYWRDGIGLSISTIAKINAFFPNPTNDPSFRVGNTYEYLDPIVFTATFDLFFPFKRPLVGKSLYADWKEFLFSAKQVFLLASCGRPLMALYYLVELKRRLGSTCRELVSFNMLPKDKLMSLPLSKLCKAGTPNELGMKFGRNECTAILSLTTGNNQYPPQVEISELIMSNGMFAVGVDKLNHKVAGMYLSEGVFNAAASILLNKGLASILKFISKSFLSLSPAEFDTGMVGEVTNRMLALVAQFRATRNNNPRVVSPNDAKSECEMVFEPVALEDFLDAYVGVEHRRAYMAANPGLVSSYLRFNHFFYFAEKIVDPRNVAAVCLLRGAACATHHSQEGVDSLIPLVLDDGRVSFVYLQTKCGPSYSSRLGEASFLSGLFARSPPLVFGDLGGVPYAYLVHHIDPVGGLACSVLFSPDAPTGEAAAAANPSAGPHGPKTKKRKTPSDALPTPRPSDAAPADTLLAASRGSAKRVRRDNLLLIRGLELPCLSEDEVKEAKGTIAQLYDSMSKYTTRTDVNYIHYMVNSKDAVVDEKLSEATLECVIGPEAKPKPEDSKAAPRVTAHGVYEEYTTGLGIFDVVGRYVAEKAKVEKPDLGEVV